MPITHLPNGLTVRTASAANTATGAADFNCLDLFCDGTATISSLSLSTASAMVGERAYIDFTFTSAASTTYYALPFDCNVIDVFVTADTTPRTCSGLTIRSGTAGTVYVATDATLVFDTAIGQQKKPVVTAAAAVTASGLAVVVTTAGSACNFSGAIVVQRTA